MTANCIFVFQVPFFSISKDRCEEEARNVLFLTLEHDRAILASLCLAAHQVEELFESDEAVVVGLGLVGGAAHHRDTFPACWPATACHTLIGIVHFSRVVRPRRHLNLNQLLRLIQVLLRLNIRRIDLVLLFRVRSRHAHLHNLLIGQEGKRF